MLAINLVMGILAVLFGAVCVLVALDLLHVWGFEGRRRRGSRQARLCRPCAPESPSLAVPHRGDIPSRYLVQDKRAPGRILMPGSGGKDAAVIRRFSCYFWVER